MRSFRPTFSLAAASLALALAACGGGSEDVGGPPKGDAIAKIAPPAGKQWTDVVAVTEQGGYVLGNPDAPIKLIEYGSLTCSHCADFAQKASAPLRDRYVASGAVSWELRNQIHDGLDLTMAMLVRCGTPESFHGLSEQVWQNFNSIIETVQANNAAIETAMKQTDQKTRYKAIADAAGLTDFFAARGISKDQAAQCLARPGVAEKLAEQSEKQSTELNVQGTPSFFINGTQVETKTWEQLEPLLQQAGAR